MPKIRNRIDAHESAFSSQQSSPLLSCSLSNVTRDPFPLFPDVPLNPQHRYCTPPPLDSAGTEPSTSLEVGFLPNTLSRNPSISDYLPLFEMPPPPPPPGSRENPLTLDDADQGSHQPDHRQREQVAPQVRAATVPRRSPRSTSQTTTRRTSSRSHGTPYPATSPTSSPTSTTSSPRGGRRKSSTTGRKAPKTLARKKAAANKFAPSVCSPLSQVAFTASTPTTDRSLSPTLPPQEVHGRWYIPPRKHSTGSISAPSESSSDSDTEPDYDAMYYSR